MEIRRKPENPWDIPGVSAKTAEMRLLGISSTIIANTLNRDFGTSFSRNSICGRAVREGLPGSKIKDGMIPRSKKINPFPPKPRKERIVKKEPEPVSLRISLRDAKAGQCRYIASDERGANEICGHPTGDPTKVWCDFHHAVTHQAPQPHRRTAE